MHAGRDGGNEMQRSWLQYTTALLRGLGREAEGAWGEGQEDAKAQKEKKTLRTGGCLGCASVGK